MDSLMLLLAITVAVPHLGTAYNCYSCSSNSDPDCNLEGVASGTSTTSCSYGCKTTFDFASSELDGAADFSDMELTVTRGCVDDFCVDRGQVTSSGADQESVYDCCYNSHCNDESYSTGYSMCYSCGIFDDCNDFDNMDKTVCEGSCRKEVYDNPLGDDVIYRSCVTTCAEQSTEDFASYCCDGILCNGARQVSLATAAYVLTVAVFTAMLY